MTSARRNRYKVIFDNIKTSFEDILNIHSTNDVTNLANQYVSNLTNMNTVEELLNYLNDNLENAPDDSNNELLKNIGDVDIRIFKNIELPDIYTTSEHYDKLCTLLVSSSIDLNLESYTACVRYMVQLILQVGEANLFILSTLNILKNKYNFIVQNLHHNPIVPSTFTNTSSFDSARHLVAVIDGLVKISNLPTTITKNQITMNGVKAH